ncbi:MAG: host attachment protein [Gammaproteobacteria bacterium]|nr:host attachment protein [Gammaproteobacteria bacterium]
MGGKVEPKQQEQITFARRICDRIEMARGQGKYDQLILVATPTLLGLLRKQLSTDTTKRITHELVKNITRLSAEQIRQHLPERLPQLPQ